MAEVVDQLSVAYMLQDYSRFATLLHEEFSFIVEPTAPSGPLEWGRTEELRIHQRMFAPTTVPGDQVPVPQELWLNSVAINVVASHPWERVTEYDRGPSNPTGLDPMRWTTWRADFSHSVLFETRGDVDFYAAGTSRFVIARDLAKTVSEPGAFLLYRWHEVGRYGTAKAPAGWAVVKRLYAS
jgi:hypothetical protein